MIPTIRWKLAASTLVIAVAAATVLRSQEAAGPPLAGKELLS